MNLLYIATNSCKPVAESELYYIYSYLQLQKELTSAAYVGNTGADPESGKRGGTLL